MSDLGDMIDSMWGDADPNATSNGGCFPKIVGWLIFMAFMGILIYFMKQG